MSEEERIWRLTKREHDFVLGMLHKTLEECELIRKYIPTFELSTFMGKSIRWEDLELAPRPEKEIREKLLPQSNTISIFGSIERIESYTRGWNEALQWAYHLSEEKTGD